MPPRRGLRVWEKRLAEMGHDGASKFGVRVFVDGRFDDNSDLVRVVRRRKGLDPVLLLFDSAIVETRAIFDMMGLNDSAYQLYKYTLEPGAQPKLTEPLHSLSEDESHSLSADLFNTTALVVVKRAKGAETREATSAESEESATSRSSTQSSAAAPAPNGPVREGRTSALQLRRHRSDEALANALCVVSESFEKIGWSSEKIASWKAKLNLRKPNVASTAAQRAQERALRTVASKSMKAKLGALLLDGAKTYSRNLLSSVCPPREERRGAGPEASPRWFPSGSCGRRRLRVSSSCSGRSR
eukprot:scaffold192_cov190-Pinguiococcus_pyrenoidosus.AAC.1